MRCLAWFAAAAGLLIGVDVHAAAAPAGPGSEVARRACAALTARVDALAGDAPLLLRSYDGDSGSGEPTQDALRSAAFTYDNALATIALLACDKRAQALRVGRALRAAALGDTRLRNAYRAGAADGKPLPNGWWDTHAAHWVEDAHQDGSATGNVAWTALAFLALHQATHDASWADAAAKLAHWVIANTAHDDRVGGFSGGIDGFDAAPQRVGWRATEHNIDLTALFDALDATHVPGDWTAAGASARRFVAAQWDAPTGHFFVGTLDDGVSMNRDTSGLDVQLWAQLLPDAPREWRAALAYVEREHAVAGGFDFNADRDGVWLEGSAQAALVYRSLGRDAEAQRLFATIDAQFSTGGLVYATREPRISTGLALGSDSGAADFYYYRRPHLGATAWAALAACARNPFVAQRG